MNDNRNSRIPEPPIHMLSALVTLLLDWLWLELELPATLSVVGLPALLPLSLALGAVCWLAVTLLQRFVSGEDWGPAAAKGLAMGIMAGVPYPVLGTLAGAGAGAWALAALVERALTGKSRADLPPVLDDKQDQPPLLEDRQQDE